MRLSDNVISGIGIIITIVLFVGIPLASIRYGPTLECVSEATVVEITSLQYRDATILLNTGEAHTVNQATLKPGDTICLDWEKS